MRAATAPAKPSEDLPARRSAPPPTRLDPLSECDCARRERLKTFARCLYHLRRRRDAVLGRGLFGEPGWDLLLDLFIAEREGRSICITSGCIGAAAPVTTSLRCIGKLERKGLIERRPDERDGRRWFISLTEEASRMLCEFLDEAWSSMGNICRQQVRSAGQNRAPSPRQLE